MGKNIQVNFESDVPEEQLEIIRDKIRKVLRGEAVAAEEVVGQFDPRRGGGSVGATPRVRG